MSDNNVARMGGLLSDIKDIVSECDRRIKDVLKEKENDLMEAVSQAEWEKNVDFIKSCDYIRGKKIFARRFMGAMQNVDADRFYMEMKHMGPMVLSKLTKADIDYIFFDKSRTSNDSGCQTFFNGYSVKAYGINNSLEFIKDDAGVYYAYLPVVANHMSSTQADWVAAMEKAKFHISTSYMPAEFDMYSWYKLTENDKKKCKHSDEYYEEKIADVKAGYREQIEEKVGLIAGIYEELEKIYPLCENLDKLLDNDINTLPDNIAFGSCNMETLSGHMRIPQLRKFPFTDSMWFDKKDIPTLHALYLRLLCSLPVGKVQFTVFDPNGMGKNIGDFNGLTNYADLFPAKKVIHDKEELKKELKAALEYVSHIRQKVFTECDNWVEYNKQMGKENVKKMLPYKVFTFFDVPDAIDTEIIDILRRLMDNSKDCGLLVLFSHLERPEKNSDNKWDKLEECIKDAKNMAEELNGPDESMRNIKDEVAYSIEFVNEVVPKESVLDEVLSKYLKKLEAISGATRFGFKDTIDIENLYGCSSINGLEFTIGYDEITEEPVKILIGNEPAHYLVGGKTGSGKSNLLHNLIVSACSRYSPNELQIYLLDFKEGVEFSTYARPENLPHAKIVAMEADTEYGVNVLNHLAHVNNRRYNIFKQNECTNISAYRAKNPDAIMPRILVVIDEFQVLFDGPDKTKTIEELKKLAKLGRACGIHLVMATQTLNGVEFGALESQFGGRIVLKCSADDSKRLLGGITSNNEAASELKIPYAIINTQEGHAKCNIKISVPFADPEVIRETIVSMKDKVDGNIVANTIVFEGQSLPKHPDMEEFASENAQIILGKELSFEGEKFTIQLEGKETDNILCVLKDDVIKRNIIESIRCSAKGSREIDEFIYIGTDVEITGENENEKGFRRIADFLEYIGEDMFSSRRVVVFDNSNLTKEVNMPAAIGFGAMLSDDAKKLTEYIQDASSNNSCCIALYNRIFNMRNGKMPLEPFDHRIGYGLNDEDTRNLVGNMVPGRINPERIENRCFYAQNGNIVGWFQPYATIDKEIE